MTPVEAAFAAMVLAALVKWVRRITKRVMFPWSEWRMLPDPGGVYSDTEGWDDSVENLTSWLERHPARDGWDAVPDTGRYTSNQFVQQHLAQVRNLLRRIPDEVFNDIRDEIAKGTANGDSTQAIAERINTLLDISGNNWKNRANVIAVTEVNGAYNAGWFASAQRAEQDLGRPLTKRWVASHDSHVRPTHKEADGQVRPLLTPFTVGTWPMQYPGDKAGPPEEVINCRCTAVLEA